MDELDLQLIKKKATIGVVALTSRTLVIQIITFLATFILTILLKPEIFGIFFLVSAVIAFLNYFSDIGLAAALVQKKEALSQDDLSTVFTIQTFLVSMLVLIIYCLSGPISRFYNLDSSGYWLLISLMIAFFLSSLKTIPSIILERKLEFNKLVIPALVETVIFYLLAVICAWAGWGINSFSIAVICRSLAGLIIIYLIVPWRPSLHLNIHSAKQLMTFGIPFQLNSLLALVKDDLLTLYLGKSLGFTAVGYIGWAKKWSEYPLRLIMDNINKVSFPTFSRLSHNRYELGKAVEKSIFYLLLLTIPAVLTGIILIDPLVKIIPRYAKWNPALSSFYLFSLAVFFSSVSSLLTNLIQSLGKVKIILKLMVFWTILTWILTPLFINLLGFNGVSLSILLISVTSVITVIISKNLVNYSLIKAILKPLIIGFATGLIMFLARLLFTHSGFNQILIIVLSGLLTYLFLIWKIARSDMVSLIAKLRPVS